MNPQLIEAVKRDILALIEAFPDLADDAELRADMIEGETDLHKLASRIVRSKAEDEAMADANMALRDMYGERVKRFDARAEVKRQLLKSLMDAANLDKLPLPEATLSITKPRTSVEITDADALPQGFVEIVRKPLKAEIKKALDAGETVPGASLALGESSLTVRMK